ncbi:hypothetical protein DFH06DRAFT_1329951 [Mycena polygramma]|nr:hypothetical protein DFH06DRAFT_1329951 [Mycena polygramma]
MPAAANPDAPPHGDAEEIEPAPLELIASRDPANQDRAVEEEELVAVDLASTVDRLQVLDAQLAEALKRNEELPRREGWNQEFADRWNELFPGGNSDLMPKHHHHAHRNQCHYAPRSLNHHETCGEGVETGWRTNASAHQAPFQHFIDGERVEREGAELNPAVGSTRQMAEGSRRDNIDDGSHDFWARRENSSPGLVKYVPIVKYV